MVRGVLIAPPVQLAHTVGRTVGVFWLNAAEMWIDVDKSDFVAADGTAIGEASSGKTTLSWPCKPTLSWLWTQSNRRLFRWLGEPVVAHDGRLEGHCAPE